MSLARRACLVLAPALPALAQDPGQEIEPPLALGPPVPVLEEGEAVARAVDVLLALQEDLENGEEREGDEPHEWPYQGVYRVGGRIPTGYRVGGTSIVGWALLESPQYAERADVREAVARGTKFVLDTLDRREMAPGFRGTYDVRGWGHAYALQLLLELRAHEAVPEGLDEAVDERVSSLVEILCETEIRPGGGWNYSRRGGLAGEGNRASPFMTGPTLLALFEARRQGEEVDGDVVERALDALERGRIDDAKEGRSIGYSSGARRGFMHGRPGAMGRLCATEVALYQAGRGDLERLRDAIRCFHDHWDQLEVRRRKDGTHVQPYGVAPYYVYYAHHMCAVAITLLPEEERAEWRARYLGKLAVTRLESGGWNDRVFDRSENYGTATALLSILAPGAAPHARWE